MTVAPVRNRTDLSSLIRLRPDQASTVSEAIAFVCELGGHVIHAFSPHVLLGVLPADLPQDNLAGFAESDEKLSRNERLGVDAWTLQHSPEFVEETNHRRHESVPWGEVTPPDPPAEPPVNPPDDEIFAAAMPETSAYLIGTVAVGVVFVDGPESSLQFSEAERTHVVAKVQAGLGWLAAQEPRAGVSWVYDIQEISITDAPDKKRFGTEPLESLWRDPTLAQMGFPTGSDGVLAYVQSVIAQYRTRWGYCVFFTKYPLHHFVYARKPWIVMHHDNDGWGIENIDRVFAHETGHIFGCPDEYESSKCSCKARYGYLREVNGNCKPCANEFVNCIMEKNDYAMCDFTRIHLGWRDSDGDGVLDLAEETP
jgi:hypothetical protein